MEITTFAMDLAKNKFQVHGFDARGDRQMGKMIRRKELLSFFEQRSGRCEVVMEACGGAHHWGRRLLALGYRVRLIPAQFVTPFVIGNKTDRNDADAIYEASQRPKVRPVAVKRIEQQDALLVHATREQWVKQRTALVNQMRGELAERGIVYGVGVATLRAGVRELLASEPCGEVTLLFQEWLRQRQADWRGIDERIQACEQQMRAHVASDPACQQIGEVEGIGLITASAAVALIGDARHFDSSRRLASWLGVTPKEKSSGERRRLGGLTKRGDIYLRKLFVHGARAVIQAVGRKIKMARPLNDRERWVHALVTRRGYNKACVAVAAKNARIVWALLTTGEPYRPAALAT